MIYYPYLKGRLYVFSPMKSLLKPYKVPITSLSSDGMGSVICHILAGLSIAFPFTSEILMFAYMHHAEGIWLNQ